MVLFGRTMGKTKSKRIAINIKQIVIILLDIMGILKTLLGSEFS